MRKEQHMVYFNSRCLTLMIILKPSSRTFTGEGVVKTPGIRVHFQNGMFQTDDEETIKRLRALIQSGKEKEVVELPDPDFRVYAVKKGKNVRKPSSADELSKTLNPATLRMGDKESDEGALTCPICEPPKKFKNQRALNMHLVSHRPGVQLGDKQSPPEAKVEEKPEA
jgi:hypothetical protein